MPDSPLANLTELVAALIEALAAHEAAQRVMTTAPSAEPPDEADALPPLFSIPEAASWLGISRASAYRWATAGVIPTKRLGGRVYVITSRMRELVADISEDVA